MLLVAAQFSFYNRGAVSWDLAQILYRMFIRCKYTALWIKSVAECVRCILSARTWSRVFVHVQMLDARPFDSHWSITHPAVKVSGSECVCTTVCACLLLSCCCFFFSFAIAHHSFFKCLQPTEYIRPFSRVCAVAAVNICVCAAAAHCGP